MTKSKSTEVAVIDEKRLAALREASGAGTSTSAVWPPKVSINAKLMDKEENKLPLGKYTVTVDGVQHFMDEVDMIVMEKGTQFIRFSNKTFIGCTVIEDSFNATYKDTLGGKRLGRIPKMKAEDMTTAQKEAAFTFHMLGVVDISQATDAEGNRLYEGQAAKFVPASMSWKKKKAVEKQNEFMKLRKKGEGYFDYITRFEKPHKAGVIESSGMPYYDSTMSRGDAVPLTNDLLDSIEAVKSIVYNENKRILGKHNKAQQETVNSEDDGDYTDLELVDETIPE